MSGSLTLLRTWVAYPSELARDAHGEPVYSGIRKQLVTDEQVFVRTTNIDGDGQADLRAHGGPDKAVYCYPSEHLGFWRDELGYVGHGDTFCAMGENLSVEGITEADAFIGDIWAWGEALLQISQPRWPCFKLMLTADNQRIVKRFVREGDKSGWYLRVLREGSAPSSGAIRVVERDPACISVVDAFRANRDRATEPDLWDRVCAHPALAEQWKL